MFEKGKEAPAVRKDLTAMIRQRQELDPDEARQKNRSATLRRFVGVLKAIKIEIDTQKLLPAALAKEAAELIRKLEAELS